MNSYLHAMGITQWQPKSEQISDGLWLLADSGNDVSLEHPLVQEVLKLLQVDSRDCQIASSETADKIAPSQVLWDMRAQPQTGRLRSQPLPMLCQSAPAKRELWQQIWQQEWQQQQ
ncbi:DNA polymerase III subunit psi [Shewanella sp. C32]|uniref:DNA polymerase III subunit psi n=1 Tax=Shewanella electrica TaxID=515560 RepID=A0ABT2FF95_9GAMM|nr:DNA polymerase III subunit psi [Shewanella electrica]MCH1925098.1 DNA polymerase III subunit psi [Shewanella electrica]MCS4554922.1 DNA polymerase III subunit psi [Shewanella electrica]